MPETTSTTKLTESREIAPTEANPLAKIVAQHDLWLKLLLAGVAASIILLSVDLYRDKASTSRIDSVQDRIVQLEKEVFIYRREVVEQQAVFLCMKNLVYSDYWKCFNN